MARRRHRLGDEALFRDHLGNQRDRRHTEGLAAPHSKGTVSRDSEGLSSSAPSATCATSSAFRSPDNGDRSGRSGAYIKLGVKDAAFGYASTSNIGAARSPMPSRTLTTESLTRRLRGKLVSRADTEGQQRLSIHFMDGSALEVEARSEGLVATIRQREGAAPMSSSTQPTTRQLEYLAFIAKYIARFGRSPAESDIERHFLVSAPSVNQMMQTLESRGFIARQQGVPRSIRICAAIPKDVGSRERGR